MQSGFNTNYRHRGVLFHVQTEDSGVANPHIITHLFHGGNIIASHKREYADVLDAADLEEEVRARMEGQHKEMLLQLSRGEHDASIAERLGASVFSDATDREDEGLDEAEPLPADSPETPTAAEPLAASPPVSHPAHDPIARAFGDGIVSEKPLDEVVLDYLVENARKRKRSNG
jgi:hypothetical protein